MPHALRKTVGSFSAGTRVNVIDDNKDGTCLIEVLLEPNDNFDYEDLSFDCDKELLVELRNRIDEVPKMNHKQRNDFKRGLIG